MHLIFAAAGAALIALGLFSFRASKFDIHSFPANLFMGAGLLCFTWSAENLVAKSIFPLAIAWLLAIAIHAVVIGRQKVTSNEKIQSILARHQGGVFKRIDENRELLELLRATSPKLLKSHPWVEGWLKSQDDFLVDLSAQVKPEDCRFKPSSDSAACKHFPRPWANAELSSESGLWTSDAYPLKQMLVRIQGTKFSSRDDLLCQLDSVATRLRNGDSSGEDHDDDYGYSFVVTEVAKGPSFFGLPARSV